MASTGQEPPSDPRAGGGAGGRPGAAPQVGRVSPALLESIQGEAVRKRDTWEANAERFRLTEAIERKLSTSRLRRGLGRALLLLVWMAGLVGGRVLYLGEQAVMREYEVGPLELKLHNCDVVRFSRWNPVETSSTTTTTATARLRVTTDLEASHSFVDDTLTVVAPSSSMSTWGCEVNIHMGRAAVLPSMSVSVSGEVALRVWSDGSAGALEFGNNSLRLQSAAPTRVELAHLRAAQLFMELDEGSVRLDDLHLLASAAAPPPEDASLEEAFELGASVLVVHDGDAIVRYAPNQPLAVHYALPECRLCGWAPSNASDAVVFNGEWLNTTTTATMADNTTVVDVDGHFENCTGTATWGQGNTTLVAEVSGAGSLYLAFGTPDEAETGGDTWSAGFGEPSVLDAESSRSAIAAALDWIEKEPLLDFVLAIEVQGLRPSQWLYTNRAAMVAMDASVLRAFSMGLLSPRYLTVAVRPVPGICNWGDPTDDEYGLTSSLLRQALDADAANPLVLERGDRPLNRRTEFDLAVSGTSYTKTELSVTSGAAIPLVVATGMSFLLAIYVGSVALKLLVVLSRSGFFILSDHTDAVRKMGELEKQLQAASKLTSAERKKKHRQWAAASRQAAAGVAAAPTDAAHGDVVSVLAEIHRVPWMLKTLVSRQRGNTFEKFLVCNCSDWAGGQTIWPLTKVLAAYEAFCFYQGLDEQPVEAWAATLSKPRFNMRIIEQCSANTEYLTRIRPRTTAELEEVSSPFDQALHYGESSLAYFVRLRYRITGFATDRISRLEFSAQYSRFLASCGLRLKVPLTPRNIERIGAKLERLVMRAIVMPKHTLKLQDRAAGAAADPTVAVFHCVSLKLVPAEGVGAWIRSKPATAFVLLLYAGDLTLLFAPMSSFGADIAALVLLVLMLVEALAHLATARTRRETILTGLDVLVLVLSLAVQGSLLQSDGDDADGAAADTVLVARLFRGARIAFHMFLWWGIRRENSVSLVSAVDPKPELLAREFVRQKLVVEPKAYMKCVRETALMACFQEFCITQHQSQHGKNQHGLTQKQKQKLKEKEKQRQEQLQSSRGVLPEEFAALCKELRRKQACRIEARESTVKQCEQYSRFDRTVWVREASIVLGHVIAVGCIGGPLLLLTLWAQTMYAPVADEATVAQGLGSSDFTMLDLQHRPWSLISTQDLDVPRKTLAAYHAVIALFSLTFCAMYMVHLVVDYLDVEPDKAKAKTKSKGTAKAKAEAEAKATAEVKGRDDTRPAAAAAAAAAAADKTGSWTKLRVDCVAQAVKQAVSPSNLKLGTRNGDQRYLNIAAVRAKAAHLTRERVQRKGWLEALCQCFTSAASEHTHEKERHVTCRMEAAVFSVTTGAYGVVTAVEAAERLTVCWTRDPSKDGNGQLLEEDVKPDDLFPWSQGIDDVVDAALCARHAKLVHRRAKLAAIQRALASPAQYLHRAVGYAAALMIYILFCYVGLVLVWAVLAAVINAALFLPFATSAIVLVSIITSHVRAASRLRDSAEAILTAKGLDIVQAGGQHVTQKLGRTNEGMMADLMLHRAMRRAGGTTIKLGLPIALLVRVVEGQQASSDKKESDKKESEDDPTVQLAQTLGVNRHIVKALTGLATRNADVVLAAVVKLAKEPGIECPPQICEAICRLAVSQTSMAAFRGEFSFETVAKHLVNTFAGSRKLRVRANSVLALTDLALGSNEELYEELQEVLQEVLRKVRVDRPPSEASQGLMDTLDGVRLMRFKGLIHSNASQSGRQLRDVTMDFLQSIMNEVLGLPETPENPNLRNLINAVSSHTVRLADIFDPGKQDANREVYGLAELLLAAAREDDCSMLEQMDSNECCKALMAVVLRATVSTMRLSAELPGSMGISVLHITTSATQASLLPREDDGSHLEWLAGVIDCKPALLDELLSFVRGRDLSDPLDALQVHLQGVVNFSAGETDLLLRLIRLMVCTSINSEDTLEAEIKVVYKQLLLSEASKVDLPEPLFCWLLVSALCTRAQQVWKLPAKSSTVQRLGALLHKLTQDLVALKRTEPGDPWALEPWGASLTVKFLPTSSPAELGQTATVSSEDPDTLLTEADIQDLASARKQLLEALRSESGSAEQQRLVADQQNDDDLEPDSEDSGEGEEKATEVTEEDGVAGRRRWQFTVKPPTPEDGATAERGRISAILKALLQLDGKEPKLREFFAHQLGRQGEKARCASSLVSFASVRRADNNDVSNCVMRVAASLRLPGQPLVSIIETMCKFQAPGLDADNSDQTIKECLGSFASHIPTLDDDVNMFLQLRETWIHSLKHMVDAQQAFGKLAELLKLPEFVLWSIWDGFTGEVLEKGPGARDALEKMVNEVLPRNDSEMHALGASLVALVTDSDDSFTHNHLAPLARVLHLDPALLSTLCHITHDGAQGYVAEMLTFTRAIVDVANLREMYLALMVAADATDKRKICKKMTDSKLNVSRRIDIAADMDDDGSEWRKEFKSAMAEQQQGQQQTQSILNAKFSTAYTQAHECWRQGLESKEVDIERSLASTTMCNLVALASANTWSTPDEATRQRRVRRVYQLSDALELGPAGRAIMEGITFGAALDVQGLKDAIVGVLELSPSPECAVDPSLLVSLFSLVEPGVSGLEDLARSVGVSPEIAEGLNVVCSGSVDDVGGSESADALIRALELDPRVIIGLLHIAHGSLTAVEHTAASINLPTSVVAAAIALHSGDESDLLSHLGPLSHVFDLDLNASARIVLASQGLAAPYVREWAAACSMPPRCANVLACVLHLANTHEPLDMSGNITHASSAGETRNVFAITRMIEERDAFDVPAPLLRLLVGVARFCGTAEPGCKVAFEDFCRIVASPPQPADDTQTVPVERGPSRNKKASNRVYVDTFANYLGKKLMPDATAEEAEPAGAEEKQPDGPPSAESKVVWTPVTIKTAIEKILKDEPLAGVDNPLEVFCETLLQPHAKEIERLMTYDSALRSGSTVSTPPQSGQNLVTFVTAFIRLCAGVHRTKKDWVVDVLFEASECAAAKAARAIAYCTLTTEHNLPELAATVWTDTQARELLDLFHMGTNEEVRERVNLLAEVARYVPDGTTSHPLRQLESSSSSSSSSSGGNRRQSSVGLWGNHDYTDARAPILHKLHELHVSEAQLAAVLELAVLRKTARRQHRLYITLGSGPMHNLGTLWSAPASHRLRALSLVALSMPGSSDLTGKVASEYLSTALDVDAGALRPFCIGRCSLSAERMARALDNLADELHMPAATMSPLLLSLQAAVAGDAATAVKYFVQLAGRTNGASVETLGALAAIATGDMNTVHRKLPSLMFKLQLLPKPSDSGARTWLEDERISLTTLLLQLGKTDITVLPRLIDNREPTKEHKARFDNTRLLAATDSKTKDYAAIVAIFSRSFAQLGAATDALAHKLASQLDPLASQPDRLASQPDHELDTELSPKAAARKTLVQQIVGGVLGEEAIMLAGLPKFYGPEVDGSTPLTTALEWLKTLVRSKMEIREFNQFKEFPDLLDCKELVVEMVDYANRACAELSDGMVRLETKISGTRCGALTFPALCELATVAKAATGISGATVGSLQAVAAALLPGESSSDLELDYKRRTLSALVRVASDGVNSRVDDLRTLCNFRSAGIIGGECQGWPFIEAVYKATSASPGSQADSLERDGVKKAELDLLMELLRVASEDESSPVLDEAAVGSLLKALSLVRQGALFVEEGRAEKRKHVAHALTRAFGAEVESTIVDGLIALTLGNHGDAKGLVARVGRAQSLAALQRVLTDLAGPLRLRAEQRRTDSPSLRLGANNIIPLTRESVFKLIDRDSDGQLEFEEFKNLWPFFSISISDQKLRQLFNRVDADLNGHISCSEFDEAIEEVIRGIVKTALALSGNSNSRLAIGVLRMASVLLLTLVFILFGIVAFGTASGFSAVVNSSLAAIAGFGTAIMSKSSSASSSAGSGEGSTATLKVERELEKHVQKAFDMMSVQN